MCALAKVKISWLQKNGTDKKLKKRCKNYATHVTAHGIVTSRKKISINEPYICQVA